VTSRSNPRVGPATGAGLVFALLLGEISRRWDMTLSTWLRDYLYIPLGGNRRGRFRTYFNLLMTMLLAGLGHGANWTGVIWGGLHGLALAGHKLWIETSKGRYKMQRFLSWAATYALRMLRVDLLSLTQFHDRSRDSAKVGAAGSDRHGLSISAAAAGDPD